MNLHRIAPTRPSSVRVYQFRHLGKVLAKCTNGLASGKQKPLKHFEKPFPLPPRNRQFLDVIPQDFLGDLFPPREFL